ncbi:MAG: hypothetical protein ACT4O2_11590 [Beijerinckiaceae bacterium]
MDYKSKTRDADFYRTRLGRFQMLSHVTIEVRDTIASGNNANKTSTSGAG